MNLNNSKNHLTIILVTHERPQLFYKALFSVLNALKESSFKNLQLLICINGVDKASIEIAQQLQQRTEQPLTLISNLDTLSPVQSRNQLLSLSNGEWTLFLDDDVFVPLHYFKVLGEVIAQNPLAKAIGGPNLNPPDSHFFQMVSGLCLASWWGAGVYAYRYKKNKKADSADISEKNLILCNLLIRGNDFRFFEGFLCGEENILLEDLKSKGFHFIYSSELYVYHHRREDFLSFVKQIYKYGYGRGEFIKKFKTLGLYPGLALVGLMLTLLFILFLPLSSTALAIEVFLEFIFSLYFAIRIGFQARSLKSVFLAWILFPMIHVFYALGITSGFLKKK